MGDAVLEPTILGLNFIRPGSLQLTQRGPGQQPRWVSDEIKKIQISLGLCSHPLELSVRRFLPTLGEVVARNWIAPDGVTHIKTSLAPYAIDDLDEAAAIVHDYIRDSCLCFAEVVRDAHPAIQLVYRHTAEHVRELRDARTPSAISGDDREIRELMDRYCPLWWGIRNMMGSAWLVGPENLSMEPVYDEGYPLYGKISVPRQVVQTAGCLLNQATHPHQTRFLDAFRAAIDPGRGQDWGRKAFYTIFILVFVLLHECEDISKDRERYARQNFMTMKFSMPEYVTALHDSARQLLSHWMMFTKNLDIDFSSKERLEVSLAFLPEPKRNVVVGSFDAIVNKTSPMIRASPETWTKDLCFVTHMFGVPWAENALYRGD